MGADHDLVASPPVAAVNGDMHHRDALVLTSSLTKEITINADSASDTNLSFSTVLPPGVVLDRCVFIEYDVEVTIKVQGADAIQPALSDWALSQFPLSRCMRSLNVTLNNVSKSVQPHLLCTPLAYYNHKYDDESTCYGCPSQPDAANSVYAAGRYAAVAGAIHTRQLKLNSQFRKHSNETAAGISQQPSEKSRGGFLPYYGATANIGGVQCLVLRYHIAEPLAHSYFSDFIGQDYLSNISTFRVDMTFTSLLPMIQIGGMTANNVRVALTDPLGANPTIVSIATVNGNPSRPTLKLRTYQAPTGVPKQVSHSYQEIITKTFNCSEAAAFGANGSFNTGLIMFPGVPEKLLMFVRKRNEYTGVDQANAFGAIKSLQIRTESDSGALSMASQAQLFQMCKRNNLSQNWAEFSSLVGSVVLVDLAASNLGGYVPGTMQSWTAEISGNFTNTIADNWTSWGQQLAIGAGGTDLNYLWDLVIVAFIPGKLIAEPNMASIVLGYTQAEVQSAVSDGLTPGMHYDHEEVMRASGWWKDFKRGFKRGVKGVSSTVNAFAPLATAMAPEFAPEIGFAQQGTKTLSDLVRGKTKGGGFRLQG